ncbi:MAG: hypothetical protein OXG44_08460 [Gammaproteobacteria bacterium]|nr:hypothetical protein [Gammaproteobacteria bacterium]
MIPRESDRVLSLMAATLQNIHDTQREQLAVAKEIKDTLERMEGSLVSIDQQTHPQGGDADAGPK